MWRMIKTIIMILLMGIILALACVVEKKEDQLDKLQQKSERVDSLTAALEIEKRINKEQSERLIQLTYQHEDDEILAEGKQ